MNVNVLWVTVATSWVRKVSGVLRLVCFSVSDIVRRGMKARSFPRGLAFHPDVCKRECGFIIIYLGCLWDTLLFFIMFLKSKLAKKIICCKYCKASGKKPFRWAHRCENKVWERGNENECLCEVSRFAIFQGEKPLNFSCCVFIPCCTEAVVCGMSYCDEKLQSSK